MKMLALLGGGHAHLAVLKQLKAGIPSGWRVKLITQSRYQTYSGMLPGWVAGHYPLSDCQIDLLSLCQLAGIELIIDVALAIDTDQQIVALYNAPPLRYDLLSIDIGADSDVATLASLADKLIPIRPLEGFIQKWSQIKTELQQGKPLRVAVVGGGAAAILST
nr:hypothetical protein [uncultured Deefgea sp.]